MRDATVGSGNVVNEVQNAYNDFGQLETQYQAHAGAVNTSTSPKVEYAYTDGSSNHARPTTITYPSGRIVRYEYTSGADDNLSRISYLADDASGSVGTHLAEYTYLGMGMVVKVDYAEPDIRMDLAHGAGADPYEGLDRFGRVRDLLWRNYGTSTDTVRIKHGYDRAGNRLYREDPVAAANGKHFDELYTYDGMYQLKDMQRGQLTGTKDGITSGTLDFAQDWAFDALGNWTEFKEDDNGDGSWDLDQTRTHNEVNEITGISETAGPAWPTPAYDRNGNMSSMPQPLSPTVSYTATWDAWNRLVKLADGSDTVAEHQYDGQKWRTVSKSYTAGILSETRQQFYSNRWQLVEERVGSSADPDRQFVWGLRYIDDLVLRDRDTNADGTLDERLYAMQDPNWNVVAVTSTAGTVQERYAYEPYGEVAKLSSTFGASSATIQWSEILYAGYRLESSTGLYYVRYRYYSDPIGRWLSRDPYARLAGEIPLYRYVANSPLLGVDAFGLWRLVGTMWSKERPYLSYIWQSEPGDGFDSKCMTFIDSKWYEVACPTMPHDDPQGPTFLEGMASIFAGRSILEDKCRKCCTDNCTVEHCYEQVGRVIFRLATAWATNYGKGPHHGHSDPVGGYYCWDWANIFDQALPLKHTHCFSIGVQGARSNVIEDGGETVHYYLYIQIGRKTNECTVAVDDGFFRANQIVHDWKDFFDGHDKWTITQPGEIIPNRPLAPITPLPF